MRIKESAYRDHGHPGIHANRPFVVYRADHVEMTPAETAALILLTQVWATLPRDEHTTKPGVNGILCSRSRAFGRVEFRPRTGEIVRLGDTEFVQGANNLFVPGVHRRFGHVPDEVLVNEAMLGLIRLTWSLLDIDAPWSAEPWEIGLHLIRAHANRSAWTHVVPEGPHSDGFARIAMVSMGQRGLTADSGITSMYLKRGFDPTMPASIVRLQKPGDIIVANDYVTMHDVSPIKQADGHDGPADRDALVLTIHQTVSGSPYPTSNPSQ